MSEGFRTFDHTGDLGLEVWAASRERLFALAALGLMAQIADGAPSEPARRATAWLEAADPEALLVDWLNAALTRSELERAVWTRATVAFRGPATIAGLLEGPRRDPRRMTFLREVKAVSHHALELALEPGACRARVVLDI